MDTIYRLIVGRDAQCKQLKKQACEYSQKEIEKIGDNANWQMKWDSKIEWTHFVYYSIKEEYSWKKSACSQ